MTRINAGVRPDELSREHLIAEHREIKRIPNLILKGKFNLDGIPEKFKLGTGHVKFFYNKLGYLYFRYLLLRDECYKRGYNVTDYGRVFIEALIKHPDLGGDYYPSKEDRQLILDRIEENKRKKDEKVF